MMLCARTGHTPDSLIFTPPWWSGSRKRLAWSQARTLLADWWCISCCRRRGSSPPTGGHGMPPVTVMCALAVMRCSPGRSLPGEQRIGDVGSWPTGAAEGGACRVDDDPDPYGLVGDGVVGLPRSPVCGVKPSTLTAPVFPCTPATPRTSKESTGWMSCPSRCHRRRHPDERRPWAFA
jgi:hypothetical protein